MNTLRKFITYYSPYKTVFFIDLLCAAFISIVDLAYPQILRVLTNTLFTKDSSLILHALPFIAAGLLFMYLIQSLCKYYVSYQGHMMGANMERDMRQQLFDQVFSLNDDVSPESIDLYIHRLRKKLTGSGVRITTLRGLGYVLECGDEVG